MSMLICTGLYSAKPRFISLSVPPITKTEAIAPMIKAICCFDGVAPTRKPVFRSCDVPPALAAATHTTPPIVSASAEYVPPVQPASRNTAQVAISVAIAMPLMGFEEVPINPVMREETVVNKKPKTTTKIAARKLAKRPVLAPGMGRNVSKTQIMATTASGANHHELHGQVVFEPAGHRRAPFAIRLHLLEPGGERGPDRGHRLGQRDHARRGHGPRAHRPDITRPQLVGVHQRNGNRAGIERLIRRQRTEKANRRHQHQPGENAARKQNAGDARADDIAHAEILRRDVGAKRCAGEPFGIVRGRIAPNADRIHQHRIQSAQAQPPENAAGEGAAAIARHQNVGARRAFGIEQVAVLFDDELAAQRNHEKHAQPSADQRQEEDAPVLQRKSQEDQRGQSEDHSAGNRFAGRAGGLHDVVFEDADLAEGAQDADGEHGDGNRGRDGESGAQTDVHGDRAEEKARDDAGQDGPQGEFGNAFFRIDVRLNSSGGAVELHVLVAKRHLSQALPRKLVATSAAS